MESLVHLTGPAAPLVADNTNTDMISPLYTPGSPGQPRGMAMTRADLARMLFAGLRYDKQDNELPDFILNREPFRHACFLIGGVNFGCGSSRDTAPKMLSAFGIRCVIAPSYGAIFYDNCFKSGVLPMILDEAEIGTLAGEAEAGGNFVLDLEAKTLATPSGRTLNFDVPLFRREQLLVGADDIELTLRRSKEIVEYQNRERAMRPWTFLS
jgi:3-isopropylmalate/(R)-2-methylmalate dehydratase small subunit